MADAGREHYNVSSANFHRPLTTDEAVWLRSALEDKNDRRPLLIVGLSITAAVGGLGVLLMQQEVKDEQPSASEILSSLVVGVISAVGVIVLLVSVPWLITRRTYMKNQNALNTDILKTQQELRHEALEKLKKTTELATLMELNQDQIATYHRIVTQQADKSFKSSRTAMGVGLFLIVCAAVGGAYVPVEEVRWFIGALAAFSTLLTGYLTKTYLAMYKESIGQLNRYFDQPVLNSFYLTAERLVSGLDEEHAQDVRCRIIDEVLATSSRRSSPAVDSSGNKLKATPKKRAPKKRTSSMNGAPPA
ncbi:hypothetical protein ACFVGN_29160 [Streptomyces sp. NPDC057757]|uniref:hypothetical protein n=1 Tax=Streptomyces sp. NPDC057757 TaxID=3346241 RepID=UPI003675BDCC